MKKIKIVVSSGRRNIENLVSEGMGKHVIGGGDERE